MEKETINNKNDEISDDEKQHNELIHEAREEVRQQKKSDEIAFSEF